MKACGYFHSQLNTNLVNLNKPSLKLGRNFCRYTTKPNIDTLLSKDVWSDKWLDFAVWRFKSLCYAILSDSETHTLPWLYRLFALANYVSASGESRVLVANGSSLYAKRKRNSLFAGFKQDCYLTILFFKFQADLQFYIIGEGPCRKKAREMCRYFQNILVDT